MYRIRDRRRPHWLKTRVHRANSIPVMAAVQTRKDPRGSPGIMEQMMPSSIAWSISHRWAGISSHFSRATIWTPVAP